MPTKKSFIKQFWKERKMIGAMAPSSRFLADKMLNHIDFNNTKVIIELGPGTGVFTDRILKMMRNDAVLLVFELNDDFYATLKKRITDSRVHIIHDTAEKIESYLNEFNIEKADVVISSLPLANFPSDLRKSILSASHNSLTDLGKYVQFQYSLQSKRQIKNIFNKVDISFTPFNFPPAFVYTCKKGA
jgi:phosphatidylethanolamine/phosphatidyl-N-methylethanolamine N-methyltransferase